MKTILTLLFFAVLARFNPLLAQESKVSSGKLEHIDNLTSNFVPPRNVDVYLPPGYDGKKKFSVLYMHDGQMLFDSTTTWNKQEWGVDETVARLLHEKKIRDVIVVAVWNTKYRHSEYIPQRAVESLTKAERDTLAAQVKKSRADLFASPVNSDNYLLFLVRELKPYIDSHYLTRPDAGHTFIAGSSMGGLISMYAICEYPDVFGGAACLSTHWPGIFTADNPLPDAFFNYLRTHLPNPRKHKIYFDYGDATLDAMYPPFQQRVDKIMEAHGWTSKNWQTRYFPGQDHSERSWRSRLDVPLLFLLGR